MWAARPYPLRMPTKAPITGVATGNLGTATNLDDTQEFDLDDLVTEGPAEQVPDVPPVVDDEPVLPLPADDPPSTPVERSAVRRYRPRGAPARRPLSSGARFGWGVFAGAAIVAVLVGAILGSGLNANGGAATVEQSFGTLATPVPPTETDGGKGHGNGKGNGGGGGKGGG